MGISTREDALKVFSYDPEQGKLYWKAKVHNTKIGDMAGHTSKGYTRISYQGVRYYLHRLIWLIESGSWPTEVIDHIDGDPSNNRISNLRDVSQKVNIQNTRKTRGRSRAIGVFFDSRVGKYRSHIYRNGIGHYLGHYDDWFEAVCSRKSGEARYNEVP